MKLRKALDIARDCGLQTVGEAYLNIDMHSISIFAYDELDDEMNELTGEYNKHFEAGVLKADTSIEDAYSFVD